MCLTPPISLRASRLTIRSPMLTNFPASKSNFLAIQNRVRAVCILSLNVFILSPFVSLWWACQDSNLEPRDYESPALTIELQAHFVNKLRNPEASCTPRKHLLRVPYRTLRNRRSYAFRCNTNILRDVSRQDIQPL